MTESTPLTREQKKQILDHEFAELRRVGSVVFDGYVDYRRVTFDLSVLKSRNSESKDKPYQN